jgi:thiol-disulfide isomerase/thioredoxin
MLRWLALTLTFMPLVFTPQRSVEMRIAVLMPDGKPVPNVGVGTFWTPEIPSLKGELRPYQKLATGADGTVQAKLELDGKSGCVIAMIPSQRLGGHAIFDAGSAGKTITIRLAPLRKLNYELRIEGLKELPKDANMAIYTVIDGNAQVSYITALQVKGSLFLPPGRYRFWPSGEAMTGGEQWLDVPEAEGEYTLPPFTPRLTNLATIKGKAAPALHITGTTQPKKGTTLESYRGKWVLIDFWGTWCSPCVNGMPKLVSFYNKHKAQRDRFEILAIHDGSAKTMKELLAKMRPIEKAKWKGPLPFPVLLDGTGATVKDYGIVAFPTLLLIDPEGRIVKDGSLEMLESKLK